MNIDELRDLLERYRQGSCTAREKEAVESWYAALHPGEEAPLSADVLEESLARVRERLPWVEGRDGGAMRTKARVLRMGDRGRNVLVAAAVLAMLVSGIWLLRLPRKAEGPVVAASGAGVMVITQRGETRQIVLPDGSTLELNAGTEIHYSKLFDARERLVELTRGEAFFQVVADAARPFVVISGDVRTKVLGTSFDIRAYREEGRVRVAVLSGKVAVGDRVLEKGMLARMDSSGVVVGRFDGEEEVAAWKQGGLYFKDASFEQIAFEVANKYNIPLINRSSKRVWSYTGFFRSESLQEVVETICQTENLQYRFSNGELVIF
jgi:transmembrane sensor